MSKSTPEFHPVTVTFDEATLVDGVFSDSEYTELRVRVMGGTWSIPVKVKDVAVELPDKPAPHERIVYRDYDDEYYTPGVALLICALCGASVLSSYREVHTAYHHGEIA